MEPSKSSREESERFWWLLPSKPKGRKPNLAPKKKKKDYAMDSMVERHMQNLENIASGTHRGGFASEMSVPSLPDLAVYETVHLPIARMGEKRARRKKPREIDE